MFPIGGPGQRETIRGGRDQDLLTPFWQTVAICVCCAWIIGWLVALALVVGSVLGYVLSFVLLLLRWRYITRRHTQIPWQWIVWNIGVVHSLVPYLFDAFVWTGYILPWSPWLKMLWSLICCVMIAPPGLLVYVLAVRILDPNYPSPRKATDQREPQMPWYRDNPEALEIVNPPRLLRIQVDNADNGYGVLDLPPVIEWYDFAGWLIENPGGFSEPNAKRFEVKITLKQNKPPWYGRGFRQVRDDLLARQWADWVDSSARNLGLVLYSEALAAFERYYENGPPPLRG